MGIIAKGSSGGTGTPGPDGRPRGPFQVTPAGPQQAVCCDVVDLGNEPNPFRAGAVLHKIRIKWQSKHLMADGRPYLIQKKYTLSLDPKAHLSKDLESWRGKAFTDDERKAGFDTERLIGQNCFLNVVHSHRKGNTYADVMTVMRCPKEMPRLTVHPEYVRDKVKAEAAAAAAAAAPPAERQPGDEDETSFNPDEFDQRVDDSETFDTDAEF